MINKRFFESLATGFDATIAMAICFRILPALWNIAARSCVPGRGGMPASINLQEGFGTLTDLMTTIRESLESQSSGRMMLLGLSVSSARSPADAARDPAA